MPRYIDADAFIQFVETNESIIKVGSRNGKSFHTGRAVERYYIFDLLRNAPTISPDEVRGVGETTGDDACPSCGCWIPTDDAHDAIFKNEVKFCYYCGMRLRMKGAEDGTTD